MVGVFVHATWYPVSDNMHLSRSFILHILKSDHRHKSLQNVFYRVILPRTYSSTLSVSEMPRKLERSVPKTLTEYSYIKSMKPVQPSDPKLLRVTIVGLPNVGKSTLINHLMQWKICSVSKKVHTTRHNARAVLVDRDTQVVFLDTPGVVDLDHGRKHNLEATMVVGPEHSLVSADAIGVMVDASDHWRRDRIDSNILRLLSFHRDKESFLVLNKVDLLESKRKLLECVHTLTRGIVGGVPTYRKKTTKRKQLTAEELFEKAQLAFGIEAGTTTDKSEAEQTGWPHFNRVFMISALNDDGVGDVREYLLQRARSQPWMFPYYFVTDQNPHEIAITTVRSKILDYLDKEVPYNLQVKVEKWDVDTAGILHIAMRIEASQSRHIKHVIGSEGSVVRKIAFESRQELANTFRCDVSLKLIVNKT